MSSDEQRGEDTVWHLQRGITRDLFVLSRISPIETAKYMEYVHSTLVRQIVRIAVVLRAGGQP